MDENKSPLRAAEVVTSKFDGKISWIATNKLNVNGRFGWLHYTMNDPPVFGDSGGGPVASAGGRAPVRR